MEIGQRVKVYRLRDRAGQEVIKRLGQIGTIKAFKMVDGSGVGVYVEFTDQALVWFFDDEVKLA
jgi:hypothetical protein